MRRWILILLALASLIPDTARACSCSGAPKPLCETVGDSQSEGGAIFLGTVESVYPTREQYLQIAAAYFEKNKVEAQGPFESAGLLLGIWGSVLTKTEAAALRKGDAE